MAHSIHTVTHVFSLLYSNAPLSSFGIERKGNILHFVSEAVTKVSVFSGSTLSIGTKKSMSLEHYLQKRKLPAVSPVSRKVISLCDWLLQAHEDYDYRITFGATEAQTEPSMSDG